VGGRHGVSLPERGDDRQKLARPLPVLLAVVEGKQARDTAVPAMLVESSRESAELHADAPLAAFANLRLRLPAPGRGEIYAKVTSVSGNGAYVIRFTSVDPDAARAIDEALTGPPAPSR
jgi:hypothetical protein